MKGRQEKFNYFPFLLLITLSLPLHAKKTIDLTLDSAVEIAMQNSYSIRTLQLGIERTRLYLKAERAGLRSKIFMNLNAPEIRAVSDYKWNSVIQRDEIVRQNTMLWQMDLSIRQPIILFGYPTNGYLSLNNQMYQYTQRDNGNSDISYYNRYFIKFEQPFFQPNRLKNDIEEAELDLEQEEIEYITDIVELIDDITDDYYDLFELSFLHQINLNHVKNLQQIADIIEKYSDDSKAKNLDRIQIQVELANARETVLGNLSNLRLESARMKQRLSLSNGDSLQIKPEIIIKQIEVDLETAIQYGFSLRPRIKELLNRRRLNEISLENTKGWNSFRVNLEMTYGVEKQDENYRDLWNQSDNSYSIALNAYIPIWDWGQRKARIAASKINIKRTDVWMERTKHNIESEISNAVMNLDEYQRRILNMKQNLEMAKEMSEANIIQYQQSKISLQDLLQTIDREKETNINFLNAYIGYRQSLLTLMMYTYYDFENEIPLLEKYGKNT